MDSQTGVESILHYLDDFLIVGAPGSLGCAHSLASLLHTFERLGVSVAMHKLEGPATNTTFLGIQIDTRAMQLSLPQEKLVALRELITSWKGRRSCTRRELECLAGKLQHARLWNQVDHFSGVSLSC